MLPPFAFPKALIKESILATVPQPDVPVERTSWRCESVIRGLLIRVQTFLILWALFLVKLLSEIKHSAMTACIVPMCHAILQARRDAERFAAMMLMKHAA